MAPKSPPRPPLQLAEAAAEIGGGAEEGPAPEEFGKVEAVALDLVLVDEEDGVFGEERMLAGHVAAVGEGDEGSLEGSGGEMEAVFG